MVLEVVLRLVLGDSSADKDSGSGLVCYITGHGAKCDTATDDSKPCTYCCSLISMPTDLLLLPSTPTTGDSIGEKMKGGHSQAITLIHALIAGVSDLNRNMFFYPPLEPQN
jgi:hypothetical protein